MNPCPEAPVTVAPKYARFSRRFRGIVLDWMILMAILFGALMLTSTVRNDNFSRALGILVVAALLLYEPVLVSFTGSTLGHYFTNLRVVDERSGGNVSFLKACARVAIKGVLGLYSFVVLAATRRNQAIHDLLTRSTVQIRDPAKALPGQYVSERSDLADANLPSRWRRVVVICVYLVLIFVVYLAIVIGLNAAGIMSNACVNNASRCSAGERVFDAAAAVVVLLLMALIIARGWKGKLFGAHTAR
ncbi:putative RDD family membrane protein YckC [Bradyrhizobium sp. AZCC 1719]|uniref:RDD family protein n=1 Tax=Bradyrhizobium sp. AZCC 1719 TaxID=3117028 RepID=UPI002FEF0B7E